MKNIKQIIVLGFTCLWMAGAVYAASPKLLSSGDTINVSVKGEPDLTGEWTVDYEGSVELPLIGAVGVAGLRTDDAAKIIKQHYEDGFLNNAIVTVTITGKATAKPNNVNIDSAAVSERQREVVSNDDYNIFTSAVSLVDEEPSKPVKPVATKNVLVEIKDADTDVPVTDAILSIGNKVYQANRLGQIVVGEAIGRTVIIASGYNTLAGDFKDIAQGETPRIIYINKTSYQKSVNFTVVDAVTKKPLKNVEITLEGGKITTNSKGEFKIGQIKKEFSEMIVKKRGYKPIRMIVDYKDSPERVIEMEK